MRKQIVCLDPGHGGPTNRGASHNGITEAHYNLDFAVYCEHRINHLCEPIEIKLTRKDDVALTLKDRAQITHVAGAGLVISIHVNAHSDPRLHGAMAFHLDRDWVGRSVCAAFLRSVPTLLKRKNEKPRATKTDHRVQTHWLARPRNVLRPHLQYGTTAVLIELAYCSNQSDALALNDVLVQSSLATAVQAAIEAWRVIDANH